MPDLTPKYVGVDVINGNNAPQAPNVDNSTQRVPSEIVLAPGDIIILGREIEFDAPRPSLAGVNHVTSQDNLST